MVGRSFGLQAEVFFFRAFVSKSGGLEATATPHRLEARCTMHVVISDRFLWLASLGSVLAIHVVWTLLDDRPPVWDMAHHQIKGWECLKLFQEGGMLEGFSRLSGYYPPLYYLQEALVLRFWTESEFLPLLANLPGLLLLASCTRALAVQCLLPSRTAILAGLLPLLLPLVAWTSRVSLLDVALCGWVSAALYLLVRSDLFQKRGLSLLLGLVIAAGMLTKWTFVLFLLFPVGYCVLKSENRERSILNLVDAGILSAPLILWWYLPNLKALLLRFQTTSEAAIWEQDPGIDSLLGWIYYPRVLASYYLFLPLTLLLVWALARLWARRDQLPLAMQLILVGFAGGLLLLTLLPPKDPRYAMPLACLAALPLIYVWGSRRIAPAIFALAFIQFLTLSFSFPLVPRKVALFEVGDDTDYRSLRQEWVLYASEYFDVAGPPKQEDWRYTGLLGSIVPGAKVGFVPDLAHFHPSALKLWAIRQGRNLDVVRLGQTPDSVDGIGAVDVVVGKTGFQGISYITSFNQDVYDRLNTEGWPLASTWQLPDGEEARIWNRPLP